MARLMATSSSAMPFARASAASARRPGGNGVSAAVIVSSAQRRFTAVGRVASSASHAEASARSAASARIANQTPYAAVAPMSGAPRTCMLEMARAASSTDRSRTVTNAWGNAV